ncbi:MAG: tetraacyldisaccharide 4'-kinase [Planctomycetes bacterium]|nr:tetraacyldisaccharide 4'-kinase [Planctomycetota bacterium]
MWRRILLSSGDVPGARLLGGRDRRARILRAPLVAAAAVYGVGIRAARLLARAPIRASVPVISVGNITAGGTGKTPFVEWVAREAIARGRRPGILSRGYGGGDEVRLLAERLPEALHRAGPDRARIARTWAAEPDGPDLIVLDDGFQHRRLARDVDFVLLDAIAPFGFSRLIPAGLLREPLDGLGRATAIAITRSDLCHPDKLETIESYVRLRWPRTPTARVIDRPVGWRSLDGEDRSADTFRGEAAIAVCGIGNPAGFFRRIDRLGIRVTSRIPFPDHTRYTPRDLEEIERRARGLGSAILITEKDAVKIDPSHVERGRWWILRSEIAFSRGETRFGAILETFL